MFRSILVLILLAGAGWRAEGFVFYRVGDSLLRWNVNNFGLHTNVVNPVSQAIRYYIASDAYSATNRANEINAIRAAFDQWQLVPGAKVKFEFAGFVAPDGLDTRFDNTNVVYWTKQSLRVAAGTQDLNQRRAWTSVNYATDGSILEADIVLNGVQYQWFTDYERPNLPNPFVEATLLHEIGHLLGLDHSPAGGASVMNGAFGVATELGLSEDDSAGARYLYPAANGSWGSIKGTVRMNGSPVFGALVTVENAAGNVAGATVTGLNGEYLAPSLAPGAYRVRVSPFDPPGPATFLRADEIAGDYAGAQTAFLPTGNFAVTVAANQAQTADISVTAGEPATRILGLSKPAPEESAVTFDRTAVSIRQGQSNYFTGVISRTLQPGSTLTITGDGISVGATRFLPDRFGVGLHALLAPVSVSSNATPGLRSFVVSHASGLAYANGYFEVAPASSDFNLDGLDDRFQRLYWSPWTTNAAAPEVDADGDFFSNRYEFLTGTDPTSRTSFSLRLNLPQMGRFGTTLTFPADPGRRYQLFSATDLSGGGSWTGVGGSVTAAAESLSITDPGKQAAKYYRLEMIP